MRPPQRRAGRLAAETSETSVRCAPLLVALGLLGALAASSGCQQNTGVFLSLTTDLGAPGVLASVRLSVKSGDQVRFDNGDEPWKLGPEEDVSLPGTLAFYADQGSPVATFEVEGLAPDGRVIVSRRALLSTVPGEMLYLRLSLSRACVTQDQGGSLAERCTEDTTCVEGRCVPVEIAPTTLPRYQPGKETLLSCSPAYPAIDTRTGKALTAAGSCGRNERCQEGICLPDRGCPSGDCPCPGDVCEAQTLALSERPVRLALSDGTVYFSELGAGPGQGRVRALPKAGGPTRDVATDLGTPGALRFQEGRLVFLDRGTPDQGNGDGRIFVQHEPDGGVVLYQENVPQPTDVFVDGQFVHWLREDGCFKFLDLDTPNEPYSTWVCGPEGAHAFARDTARVFYWLTADDGVQRSPAAEDGPYPLTTTGTSAWDQGDLVALGQTLFITDGQQIWSRQTEEGGDEATLASGQGITSLLADDEGLVFADGAAGTILRLPRSGGSPTVIARDLLRPRSLAQDDDALYWVHDLDDTRGAVVRLLKPKR